jgi:hypothetical protein
MGSQNSIGTVDLLQFKYLTNSAPCGEIDVQLPLSRSASALHPFATGARIAATP